MESPELLALFAVLVSILALIVPYLTFRREKKQANQDILFQEKINAYKDIARRSFNLYRDYFDIVDKVQFYEGTKEEWEKTFREEIFPQFMISEEFKKQLFTYTVILPNNIFKVAEHLSEDLLAFITSASHCDNEIIINGYDHIEREIFELIDLIRKDLNTDSLNMELLKRTR